MVGRAGLEPATSRLSGVRSNHLSYRPPPYTRQAAPYRNRGAAGGEASSGFNHAKQANHKTMGGQPREADFQ